MPEADRGLTCSLGRSYSRDVPHCSQGVRDPMRLPAPLHRRAAAHVRPGVVASVVLGIAVVATACTPGGSTRQVNEPTQPAKTGVTETEPITLTVWDQETGQVSKVWDELNAEFEEQNPTVTIERVNRDFGELKTLLKLAISGPNGPDVVEANQGWPDMGGLVK